MKHCRRAFRFLLTSFLLVLWVAGPCHGEALALVLAAEWDGQHQVQVSEGAQATTVVLHHAGSCDVRRECPPRHHHSVVLAWLLRGHSAGSEEGHPDHVLSVASGAANKEKSKLVMPGLRLAAPVPAIATPLATLSAPKLEKSIRSVRGDCPIIAAHPPRQAVLLI